MRTITLELMLDPRICGRCARSLNDTCVERCVPGRKYEHFQLKPLREFEQPTPFPLHAFLTMQAREARLLVAIYMHDLTQGRRHRVR